MSSKSYPQPPKIIVILGPTASGKSDLAVKLAKKFNGEVISADSRQVYRGMDLGAGKVPLSPPPGVQTLVWNKKVKKNGPAGYYQNIAHYLLDVTSPKRRFTAAQYKKLANKAIKQIQQKNKIPVICGGTGFYIQAVVDNLNIPSVKPDWTLRQKLEKKATPELYQQLKNLDKRRAKDIDKNNRRRLIRALEIVLKTGKPVPQLNPPQPPFAKGGSHLVPPFEKGRLGGIFDILQLGIKIAPDELKKRIKIRLQKRLKQGMIAEVKKLHAQGLSWKRLEGFGLEYRFVAQYLQGKISRQEMLDRIQKESEQYARRQMTWFKRDQRIHWIPDFREAEKLVKKFLRK